MKNFLRNTLKLVGALGALLTPAGTLFIVGVVFIAMLAFIFAMVVLFNHSVYDRFVGIIGTWKGGKQSN